MKRIMTIQDISCVGKCSLTVALPIISAMGVEAGILPTAVLSTHTAFNNFTFCDLTSEITPIAQHWKDEKIGFDAIYTGYLGSFEQLKLVSDFFDTFKTDENMIIIDPVMGDYGKLYPGFTEEFAAEMAKLCGKADLILPNMTEVSYMLGIDYVDSGYDENYVKDLLKKLCGLGAKIAAITGISFEPGQLGVMSYNSETGEYFKYFNKEANGKYHGTGDVFASCCTGALMNGLSTNEALSLAADYTARCIQNTLDDNDGRWYGVNFESEIPYLVKRLEEMK